MSDPQRRTVFLVACALILPVSVMAQSFRLPLDGTWMFRRDADKVGIDRQWYAVNADRSGWSRVSTPAFWEHYPKMATYGWGTRAYLNMELLKEISEPDKMAA